MTNQWYLYGRPSNVTCNRSFFHEIVLNSCLGAPLEHDFGLGVGSLAHHEHDGLWPTLAILELDVVVHDEVGENDLDLVSGKEAARASVLSEAKVDVVVANAAELPAVRRLFRLIPHLPEAKAVECFGVGEITFVMAETYLRGEEICSWGQLSAVRELNWLDDFANEGCL